MVHVVVATGGLGHTLWLCPSGFAPWCARVLLSVLVAACNASAMGFGLDEFATVGLSWPGPRGSPHARHLVRSHQLRAAQAEHINSSRSSPVALVDASPFEVPLGLRDGAAVAACATAANAELA